MARIIEFPKIHPCWRTFDQATSKRQDAGWLQLLELLTYLLVAPFFGLFIVAIALWPLLVWVLAADVLLQLVRIIFIGGMAAVHGWLHLGALLAIVSVIVVVGMKHDKRSADKGTSR